jgi:DNA-binding PadR family transcriptional regulator
MFSDNLNHSSGFMLQHALRAIGRGRGLGGFGFNQGRGGPDFMGGGGVPGGRKLTAANLQLVILALLEKQPAHGYELIRDIEERSNGFYVPSPGVIYPALSYLGEIGQAAVEQDGNRKLYHLTDDGRSRLKANRAVADAMLDALGRVGRRMEQVREAFAGLDALDPNAADELHRARHALKHALIRTRDCTPDEARRIATILEHAAAQILGANAEK